MPRNVRIADVADRSGVSVTTVSHVLNGKGRVAERTRRRVLRVATDLGYRPDPVARSLVTGRTGIVAITASWTGDPYFPFAEIEYYNEVIAGATGAATDRAQALVVGPTGAPESLWDALPMDGVILIDPAVDDPKIAILRARDVPMVTIGRIPGEASGAAVLSDDDEATRSVLDHLAGCGAERVGLFALPAVEGFTTQTLEVYGRWCREHGLEPALVTATQDDGAIWDDAIDAAADRFLDVANLPDAAYCLEGRLAMALVTRGRARGIRVPEDLLVATVSDTRGLADFDPPLTALEFHPRRLGATAAELLLDLLDGTAPPDDIRHVPTSLIPRRSTTGRKP